jgi:hypothetical protein
VLGDQHVMPNSHRSAGKQTEADLIAGRSRRPSPAPGSKGPGASSLPAGGRETDQ